MAILCTLLSINHLINKVKRLATKQGLKITHIISDKSDYVDVFLGSQFIDLATNKVMPEFNVELCERAILFTHQGSQLKLALTLNAPNAVTEINSTELKAQLAANKLDGIIDIREHYEHQEGELSDYLKIPGDMVTNIPSHRLLNEFASGQLGKDKHYVLVCPSGRRSKACCELLTSLNFTKLNNLSGGVAFI